MYDLFKGTHKKQDAQDLSGVSHQDELSINWTLGKKSHIQIGKDEKESMIREVYKMNP